MVLAAFSLVIDVSANEQTLPSFDNRPVEIKEHQRTKIMGVLNLTPISMSGPNPTISRSKIRYEVSKMVSDGAEIIDVGAESTRPGATQVSVEEEWERLRPFIESLEEILEDPILVNKPIISIDTYHSETVRKLMNYHVDVINDVTGTEKEEIVAILKGTEKKYILVHNMGKAGMAHMRDDLNVIDQLIDWFTDQIDQLLKLGLTKSQIILDPGIGFGKTPTQTAAILQNIDQLKSFGYPIVVGHSRKASALQSVKHLLPIERDLETACLSKILSNQNVDIVRVHNCRLNRQVIDASISLIAAYQTDRGIGYRTQLPWDLKADKQNFRKLTLNHTIIMGKKTYESIGRPLDKRRNVIISRTLAPTPKGVEVYTSLQEALEHIDVKDEIFIIGGERLFEEALPFADYLYLTIVQASEPADRFFPLFDEGDWILEDEVSIAATEENAFSYQFKTLKREANNRNF